jgi:chaperonin GroES
MDNKIKPLGDRVLVKFDEESEKKTASGIILTDNATRGDYVYGEVVSIGTGLFSQYGERIPMTVKVGDSVMFRKNMTGDKLKIDTSEYLLFHEHELLMVISK